MRAVMPSVIVPVRATATTMALSFQASTSYDAYFRSLAPMPVTY